MSFAVVRPEPHLPLDSFKRDRARLSGSDVAPHGLLR